MTDYNTRISIRDALNILDEAYLYVQMIEDSFGIGIDENRLRATEPLEAVKMAIQNFLIEKRAA